MVLTYADDTSGAGKTTDRSDVVDVRFVELVPRTRIVQAVQFESDAPEFAGTMTMTWELTPVHDGTRVEIRAEDVPRGISPEAHAAGLASSLENLNDWLARSARRDA